MGDENAPLLEAMERDATRGDWESRKRVYETLLQSKLLVPLASMPVKASDGSVQMPFRVDTDANGEQSAIAFTDELSMRSWGHTGPSAQIVTPELCSMFVRSGIVRVCINPFKGERPLKPGGWITRSELEVLATGRAPVGLIPHGLQLRAKSMEIRVPAQPLDLQTERALIAEARRLRKVSHIFYFESSVDGGTFRPTVAVRFGSTILPRNDDAVVRLLMSNVQPHMARDQTLDVVPLGASNRAEILEKAVLIYDRGKQGRA